MSDLQIIQKEVEFYGDILIAIQDLATDKIYVGVKWVCKGLGMNDNQAGNERSKINNDLVLNRGRVKFSLPLYGTNQDVLCLELNFVPLWLAKISITPTIQQDNPVLVDKLVKYQLEAKDVLAAAFIKKDPVTDLTKLSPELQMFKQLFDSVAKQHIENEAVKKQLAIHNQKFDVVAEHYGKQVDETNNQLQGIRNAITDRPDDWYSWSHMVMDRYIKHIGTNNPAVVWNDVFAEVEKRINIKFSLRGIVKEAIKRNYPPEEVISAKMTVIGADSKARETFVTVLREISIKFNL